MDVKAKDTITYDANSLMSMAGAVLSEIRRAVIGKDPLVYDIFIALLSEGNILIEGVPGVAKTTIAKVFATTVGLDFKRIQFVPDILPSDIMGASILNQKTMEFEVHKGPLFTNILLVDEINRASPKIQASLLEAMEEKQVSIDGLTFRLPNPFMVITTQNPIDVVGTFPLPEAQIDRFMFKLNVDYPTPEEEIAILRSKNSASSVVVQKVLTQEQLEGMIEAVKQVYVDEKVLEYIRDLVVASREHEKILLGASPRSSIGLLRASKAVAALDGREYVTPDDIKYLAPKVFNHRLIIKPEYEQENITANDVINELLLKIKVPA